MVPILIVAGYLIFTTLVGLFQSRKVKKTQQFTVSRMSLWQAATFLAGFTLGGGATYGVAGDTIKFGLTYLAWFPLSLAMGWWITGLLFARRYYRLGGITIPALLEKRFDGRVRLACSLSTMLYAVFIILLEIYTLAIIVHTLLPSLTFAQATLISLFVSVTSVAFSGILGASATNLIYHAVITITFTIALIAMWSHVGGWNTAIGQVLDVLPDIAKPGIDPRAWLSVTGLGWGVCGQLLLGKAGRLGGISVVSHLAASCKNEKEAVRAFWLAGLFSGIPPLLSSMLGVYTAAFLGTKLVGLPAYESIGLAIGMINPVLAAFLLAAVAAAILSAYGPTTVVLASVFVDDIVIPRVSLTGKTQRMLYTGIIILVSILSAIYVAVVGIKDILPFLYSTAFPTTAPITVVTLFALYSKKAGQRAAFWAVTLGVIIALAWGIIFNNPFGIPNIFIAFLIPIVIMVVDVSRKSFLDGNEQKQQRSII